MNQRRLVGNSLGVLFHCSHFDRNEISFRVIKYHVSTIRNEMVILKCCQNETSCEQNLFSRRYEISNGYEFIYS